MRHYDSETQRSHDFLSQQTSKKAESGLNQDSAFYPASRYKYYLSVSSSIAAALLQSVVSRPSGRFSHFDW